MSEKANFYLKFCPVRSSFNLYLIIVLEPCLDLDGVEVPCMVSLPVVAK